jgi:hypothetical protein
MSRRGGLGGKADPVRPAFSARREGAARSPAALTKSASGAKNILDLGLATGILVISTHSGRIVSIVERGKCYGE